MASTDPLVEDAFKSALATGEWKEHTDPRGRTYFSHKATKKTTWDLKRTIREKLESEGKLPPAAQAAPSRATFKKPTSAPAVVSSSSDAAAPPAQSTPGVVPSTGSSAASPPPSHTTTAQASPTAPDAPETSRLARPSAPAPVASDSVSSSSNSAAVEGPTTRPPAAGRVTPPPAVSVTHHHQPPLGTASSQPSSLSASVPPAPKYVDPIERLLDHNAQLQRSSISNRDTMTLEARQRMEALERTNNALALQLERTKAEHRSITSALTDANKVIHELKLRLAQFEPMGERSRDDELQRTLSHLREQNRMLVQQTSELTTLLATGLTETAAQMAELVGGTLKGDGPSRGDLGSSSPGAASTNGISHDGGGARVMTQFLDSAARHTLCPNCTLNVTRYRDKLLAPQESNVGTTYASQARSHAPVGTSAAATYRPVPDLATITPTTSPSPLPHSAGGSRTTGIADGPPVMYGGFVVRPPGSASPV